jgi:hypothetical protein
MLGHRIDAMKQMRVFRLLQTARIVAGEHVSTPQEDAVPMKIRAPADDVCKCHVNL